MGLASAMQTALSGMAAAEMAVSVIANNIANTQTKGFKASSSELVTQTPQTRGLGAAPSEMGGGSNPLQIGRGVQVAGISTDFSQGTLVTESDPLNVAIEGDGMFILDGPNGQRSYTRNGSFHLDADSRLVTADGFQLQGFATDNNFQIQPGRLQTLRIPVGKTIATKSGKAATLTSFRISNDGRIQGGFTDGQFRDLGQIRLARFANPSGLDQTEGNRYEIGPNSGLPQESDPGDAAAGQLLSGSSELSNTDIAHSLVELLIASNDYRANLQTIDTSQFLMDELVQLGRNRK
jgi:flagellar hook protein FlgE